MFTAMADDGTRFRPYGAPMSERFANRSEAGLALARRLRHLDPDSLVIGLPRGGIPVAAEVARERGWQMEILVARKLGVPGQKELAMGAVCEGKITVTNDDVVEQIGIARDRIAVAAMREQEVVEDRARLFRNGRPAPDVSGRVVVIVDDGLATGATARAACTWARREGARAVVLAVPVAPHGWERNFESIADECIAVMAPADFGAVGLWYDDFSEVTDGEVMRILATTKSAGIRSSFVVRVGPKTPLDADVVVPPGALGCVVFVHGSGSSRFSPRNRHVAGILNSAGLATVLFDLLTEDEAIDRGNVFDIEKLSGRLASVIDWVARQEWARGLRIGLFGASTGAAAALRTAAHHPESVACVVSRGGRPDLAMADLPAVKCPVRLIVGSLDHVVMDLNRQVEGLLGGLHSLVSVPGATHLFEEPGTLDSAAESARDFFVQHLRWPAIAAAG